MPFFELLSLKILKLLQTEICREFFTQFSYIQLAKLNVMEFLRIFSAFHNFMGIFGTFCDGTCKVFEVIYRDKVLQFCYILKLKFCLFSFQKELSDWITLYCNFEDFCADHVD